MAMISRMKLLRTSLQATRTKWMRWPCKESAEDASLSNENLFDEITGFCMLIPAGLLFLTYDGISLQLAFQLSNHPYSCWTTTATQEQATLFAYALCYTADLISQSLEFLWEYLDRVNPAPEIAQAEYSC